MNLEWRRLRKVTNIWFGTIVWCVTTIWCYTATCGRHCGTYVCKALDWSRTVKTMSPFCTEYWIINKSALVFGRSRSAKYIFHHRVFSNQTQVVPLLKPIHMWTHPVPMSGVSRSWDDLNPTNHQPPTQYDSIWGNEDEQLNNASTRVYIF